MIYYDEAGISSHCRLGPSGEIRVSYDLGSPRLPRTTRPQGPLLCLLLQLLSAGCCLLFVNRRGGLGGWEGGKGSSKGSETVWSEKVQIQ